jgi:3alpha(or 20beta)-hydroxysteroid dehydrogenase
MPLAGLTGKVVVVTGGASGIGRAVVERLLAEEASVVLVDVDAAAVEATSAALGEERLLGVAADVSTEEGTEHYFAAALERFGRIDGLHANAGIEGTGTTLADLDPDDFDRVIAVNLRGVFLAMRRMLRTAGEQGTSSSIVATASGLALKGTVGFGPYSASKAAIIALVRTAAVESGPAGHRVNAVLPGPIATPMIERLEDWAGPEGIAEVRELLHGRIPLGRYGTAPEVAALVAWLLSDESSFVNGGVYTVDGGEAAG